MIDTNVIISAVYNTNSLPAQVVRTVSQVHAHVTTDYILNECRTIIRQKLPHELPIFEELITGLNLEIVPSAATANITLNDPKDQPIIDAAMASNVDVLITGDKGFFKFDIQRPKIMTPAQFQKLDTSIF